MTVKVALEAPDVSVAASDAAAAAFAAELAVAALSTAC